MISTSFLESEELVKLGFKSFGENVKISRKVSIYSPHLISLGNNVRIDDFCILSGEIIIGSYVHVSAYTALYGRFGIELEDFVTISGRVLVYSQNDDYSGNFMTNPMLPSQLTNVTGGKVLFKKHSIIASGSIVLPNLTIGIGACLGAMSLLKSDMPDWTVFAGIPAKEITKRNRGILELEKEDDY